MKTIKKVLFWATVPLWGPPAFIYLAFELAKQIREGGG